MSEPSTYKAEANAFANTTITQFAATLSLLRDADSPQVYNQWLKVVTALARRRKRLASLMATKHYRDYRESLEVPGSMPGSGTFPALDERRFLESMKATALAPLWNTSAEINRLAETDPVLAQALRSEAERKSLVDGSGAFERMVHEGYVEQMINLSEEDPESTRWRRVTSAGCCSWCALLSTRGAVFLTAQTASFGHDHDRCTVLPDFGADDDPINKANELLWKSVTDDGFKGKEATDEFRRRYEDRPSKPLKPKSSLPTVGKDGRNPLDADTSTEKLQSILDGLETSLEKFENKGTRTRVTQIRAELDFRA